MNPPRSTEETERRSMTPKLCLRRVFAGWVSQRLSDKSFVDLKQGEIIWTLRPLEEPVGSVHYKGCTWVLSRHGLGIAANTALHDFTVSL